MSLRKNLIRLAHEHPEFRNDILPLLKESTVEFDPNEIGEEVPGALETEEQELKNEFTQQEHSELQDLQEADRLATEKTAGSVMLTPRLKARVTGTESGGTLRGRMTLDLQLRGPIEQTAVLVRFTAVVEGGAVTDFSPFPAITGAGAEAYLALYKSILQEAVSQGLVGSVDAAPMGVMASSEDSLRKQVIRLAHEHPEFRSTLLPVLKSAGCEKLPEGPMRDNCEKKKGEGKDDDKKDDKKDDGKMPADLLEKFKGKK